MRMAKHAEIYLTTAIAGGGSGHFEWPRRCRGWQKRRIQDMIARLRLVLADFDGCSFGVMAGLSLLALKPWRVVTSSLRLAGALRQHRCSGDHLHGQLSGKWATDSGHYPDEMCCFVLDALDAPGPLRPVLHGLRTYARARLLPLQGAPERCLHGLPHFRCVHRDELPGLLHDHGTEYVDTSLVVDPEDARPDDSANEERIDVLSERGASPPDLPGAARSCRAAYSSNMKNDQHHDQHSGWAILARLGDALLGLPSFAALKEAFDAARWQPGTPRQRDMFPLAPPSPGEVFTALGLDAWTASFATKFAVAAVVALNALYGVKTANLHICRRSSAQRAALEEVRNSAAALAQRLEASRSERSGATWDDYEKGGVLVQLALDAERVDVPARVGACVPHELVESRAFSLTLRRGSTASRASTLACAPST